MGLAMWLMCMSVGILFMFLGSPWVSVIWFMAAIAWAVAD